MPVDLLTAIVLAAPRGYAAFSTAVDKITTRLKNRQYEADKAKAFKEALKGDGADWSIIEAVVVAAAQRGDVSEIAARLRHHSEYSPRRAGKKKSGPKRAAKKKKSAPKKATKKRTTKRKAVPKKKMARKAATPKKKMAKRKAAPKKKMAKRKAAPKKKMAKRRRASK